MLGKGLPRELPKKLVIAADAFGLTDAVYPCYHP